MATLPAWPFASPPAWAALPGAATGQGVRPRPLVFPADFGAHPDTRIEWWYVTGWLNDESADAAPATNTPAFGFQVTFFRSRTDVPATHPSRFAASQLVLAHAALTDLAARRLRHDQRIARAGLGVVAADEGDTRVRLRDWRLTRSAAAVSDAAVNAAVNTAVNSAANAATQLGSGAGASTYTTQLQSDAAGFAFDFTLTTTQPLLLQGDAGYSRKGPAPEQASHYYSQPQLAVAGTLTRDGRAQRVRGRAWLDHEWSNSLLDPQAVGWDWIGMNLTDGSALTAFRLRRADGSSLYAGGSFRAAGTPAGTARNFEPDEVVMSPGRTWASPRSRGVYPVQWQVQTPAGRFSVNALLDDQELDGSRAGTGTIYWEGLSELRDDAGRVVGHGYLELTGYAGRLRL
ncbi:MAG: hydrolase [Methylibium sp. NZG]|nr:MAG: hydrolase [Methylibium sp. NZG]